MNATRDTWANLQRAETLLVQSSVRLSPEQVGRLWDGIDLVAPDRMYLTRFVSGFDPSELRVEDYLLRYPFSSRAAIERVFCRLADQGVLSRHEEAFAFTSSGLAIARTWLGRVGELLHRVASDALPIADAETLISIDHRIVAALVQSCGAYPTPILANRAKGLQPAFDPPQLWHHWQLVWTMLACNEDAHEHLRKTEGADPLEWFMRRQLWFVHRRPWRARIADSSLHALANRYAPVEESRSRQAWTSLCDAGIGTGSYESPALSQQGLALQDEAEERADRTFLSCWPDFSLQEAEHINALSDRLNQCCELTLKEMEHET